LETILHQTSSQELLRLAQNAKIETLALPELANEEVARLLERALDLGFDNDIKAAARASQLLLEAYDSIKQSEQTLPYQKKCIELLKAWIDGDAPFDFNQKSDACGLIADACEKMGDKETATKKRQLQLENRDGFTLLRASQEELRNLGKEISQENGARILDDLTKAAERLPQKYSEQHAEIYRATGEILEAWGDNKRAVEYFEAALKMNPKIGVKRRLEKIRAQTKLND
jgi:tetratricopeptide (TPR) repeat protein